MWTATIIGKSKQGGRILVKVEYSNGSETFHEEYTATAGANAEWLKNTVRSRIEGFNAAYTYVDSLTEGTAVDITPPAAPTQAEQELATFLQKYQRWCSVKRAIDAGILTGNEVPVQNLLNEVKALFKAAYLPYI